MFGEPFDGSMTCGKAWGMRQLVQPCFRIFAAPLDAAQEAEVGVDDHGFGRLCAGEGKGGVALGYRNGDAFDFALVEEQVDVEIQGEGFDVGFRILGLFEVCLL